MLSLWTGNVGDVKLEESMDATLTVVAGAKKATIRLKLPTIIGRSETVSLKIRQSQVSRQHCEIYEEDGLIVVHDLGSSNGTFIDDDRIDEPTFLYPGEILRVGKVVFEATYELPTEDGEGKSEDGEGKGDHGDERAKHDAERSEDAGTGAVTYEKDTDHESDSVIHYRESEEGSFLGIADPHSADPPQTGGAEPGFSIETGQDRQPAASESALKKFFDSL